MPVRSLASAGVGLTYDRPGCVYNCHDQAAHRHPYVPKPNSSDETISVSRSWTDLRTIACSRSLGAGALSKRDRNGHDQHHTDHAGSSQ